MFTEKDFIVGNKYIVIDDGANLFRGIVVGFLDGKLILDNGERIITAVISKLVHVQKD